jgi:hypothetical protein
MTHVELERELNQIYKALSLVSPETLIFGGTSFSIGQLPSMPDAQSRTPSMHPSVNLLQNTLYQYAYIQPFKGTLRSHPPNYDSNLTPDFVASLSQANTSQEYWDEGWEIVEIGRMGESIVQKGNLTRQILPGEYLNMDGIGSSPRVGGLVRLYFPHESTTFQPGFYFAFGEVPEKRFQLQSVARYYFNLIPKGAPLFIAEMTKRLNHFQIPFRLKCINHPELFTMRVDSGVVYVNRRFHRIVSEIIFGVYQKLCAYTLEETPIFTYEIAPGLAFAEDPANGESFGISRCRVVAEGIWQAYSEGKTTADAWAIAVKERFTSYGLSFEKPYLNPQSPYNYDFSVFDKR